MKINRLSVNQTEVFANGGCIFLSYDTPVAAILPSGLPVRTVEKYSVTTTKHVNRWLQSFDNVEPVNQEFLNNLLKADEL